MNSQSNKYIINIQELKKKINDMRNLLPEFCSCTLYKCYSNLYIARL